MTLNQETHVFGLAMQKINSPPFPPHVPELSAEYLHREQPPFLISMHLTHSLIHRVWKGGEGWATGLGWDTLVSPSIPAQSWACSWARMFSSWNREYTSCIHFLCCCLLQKQITTNTAASNNTDAWFYSSTHQKSGTGPISLKLRCQQGCGPFQRLQRIFPCLFGFLAKFSSLDVMELRSHFLAACQLRVVSTFILWLVASSSIFKASNSLMKLSDSLVVK